MNLLCMETALLLYEGKTQDQKVLPILEDRASDTNEVFESAGALGAEVPLRQPGNWKSWMRISRGIN